MLVLGLETAGEQGCVGLIRGERPLSETVFFGAMRHGEMLLPAVEAALKLAEVKRNDLELIAVSRGPGSFTGLRIGIAAAKGLARALEIPLVGVSAFEPYAQIAGFWDGPAWVLLTDRRDWVYSAAFKGGEQIAPPQALPLEELMGHLASASEEPLLIGPGVERHRERLKALSRAVLAPEGLSRPSAVEIARLGRERFLAEGCDEKRELEPLYLQPAPAATPNPTGS
jgi:tRNA threonylcarbamoyladenosine biosynthesis protein TsaB